MVVGEEASGGLDEGAAGPGPVSAPHSNGTSKPLTSNIHNIMGGMESTAGVKLHNHKRKLRQRFDIVRKLGQGTYGKVQLGINKETGQEVAIKTIKKAKIETEADLVRIRREIQIMSSVRHPNIIHIYEVFENREKMVLVMEYAAGGELYDYLSERKVLAEQEARRIFRQIATAVYYCHKHKICHRDLKLENILLDETGNAKIADFGLSNVFDERRLLSTFCGSPLYASPEIVKGTPYHGPEVDCWSLGVLLYTLVYGAMPFDGSNFKKLVRQISQGDYFEPKKPSPASPLVRDMLTVSPGKRADVEKICSHWWVNEGYPENCLDVAEHLASQTPVRLDLLLSLAPAPSSDKIVVPETKTQECSPVSAVAPSSFPARSHSVGSLMELDYPGGRKSSPPRLLIPPPPPTIPPLTTVEASAPKRKLQECPSGETGAKRKELDDEKPKQENMEVDETPASAKPKEKRKSVKSKTGKPGEKTGEEVAPKITENTELVSEKSATKVKRKKKVEGKNEGELPGENALIPESVSAINNSDPVSASVPPEPVEPETKPEPVSLVEQPEAATPEPSPKESTPLPSPKESTPLSLPKESTPVPLPKESTPLPVPKESTPVPSPKESTPVPSPKEITPTEMKKEESPVKRKPLCFKNRTKTEEIPKLESTSPEKTPRNLETRRKSSIFEKAEKFNSMSTSNMETGSKISPDKNKKLVIPGVKISDFKKAFEKKPPTKSASMSKANSEELKSEIPKPKINTTKSESPKIEKKENLVKSVEKTSPLQETKKIVDTKPKTPTEIKPKTPPESKPKLPIESKPKTPEIKPKSCEKASEVVVTPTRETKPPTPVRAESVPQMVTESEREPARKKSTTMKIILESSPKSATLPRRTSKAEIRLNNPPKHPEYRTEVEHMVGSPTAPPHQRVQTQRSEVEFPVSAPRQARPYKHSNTAPSVGGFRSVSLEPESRLKERIIPIRLEGEVERQSPPVRPPVHPVQPQQKSATQTSVRREPISRQSTQDSDTETVRGEAIRKSPREFIIPIAMEGGGYVTPRAGSLEPDSVPSTPTRPRPRFIRTQSGRRMGLLSESCDDESTAPSLSTQVSSEQGEEPGPGQGFHMHKLRSSRPGRMSATEDQHESQSSGDEDEDDGFEILTAESLFSTLLSRVRSLTQRLNVEDGMRPFPSSRLLSHMSPGFSTQPSSLFSNFHQPLSRRLSEHSRLNRANSRGSDMDQHPWRRGVSRDPSAADSLYSDQQRAVSPDRWP